ncbi:hypothetical protein WOLCODRAFT_19309 [Wolfiporia cocos MD-104 SS10]|uniref:Uncharacterized protein n=1 Tax=Wolfiporia cocos (strain MD-104) TaxID=742152 RepID=A0A2H3JYD5_WOLCO|nr:hypothetical protein WOLCODRAFT_19309 [Wolfiporia cocos MD-104 SS10]
MPTIDWRLFEAAENTELAPSTTQNRLSELVQVLLNSLDMQSVSSADEGDERSDDEQGSDSEIEVVAYGNSQAENGESTYTLDILMHLPCSVFSQCQLDLFLWLLKANGVKDVPTVHSMKSTNAAFQHLCGIQSIAYKGALGHNYMVNNLSQIISQVSSIKAS